MIVVTIDVNQSFLAQQKSLDSGSLNLLFKGKIFCMRLFKGNVHENRKHINQKAFYIHAEVVRTFIFCFTCRSWNAGVGNEKLSCRRSMFISLPTVQIWGRWCIRQQSDILLRFIWKRSWRVRSCFHIFQFLMFLAKLILKRTC